MITKLKPNQIFVFGSNLAGRHGAGAAFQAVRDFGAIYGQGVGLQGQSYAIPSKDTRIQVMPVEMIKPYVDEFIEFAKSHPELEFLVTPIGTGLAGLSPYEMYPLFEEASDLSNVRLLWTEG